ncbi:hypothetical protein GCM10010276_43040 [Streptomyces longisporus]|uniref:Uncharacterized protein n=1 Tax=Streptomyces longisporus TaxID=1948 RepID=A0ABN3M8B5_STRLO
MYGTTLLWIAGKIIQARQQSAASRRGPSAAQGSMTPRPPVNRVGKPVPTGPLPYLTARPGTYILSSGGVHISDAGLAGHEDLSVGKFVLFREGVQQPSRPAEVVTRDVERGWWGLRFRD